jgi:branched-subunit amino acid aminotransferase/4-amino-4-deoxychorismate lyase
MKINCSINGKPVKKEKACVSAFDNSLFYADGLFETFLAVGNKPIYLDDHLERLQKGAKLIRLKLPANISRVKKWILDAVASNPAEIKKIRVTVTAGNSAFWAGKRTPPRLIIIVTEFSIPHKPFRLTVSPYRVDHLSPFRSVKTLSFIIEMTSRKAAYSEGFDDAILLNRAGHVAEATSANIFWAKKGVLFTPPISAGCLEGMTRKHILILASQLGIPAQEKKAKLAELLNADEVFISSSLKLIMPVTYIRANRGHKYRIGPITKKLRTELYKVILSRE